ncbi:MAG: hypothetical protein Q7R49_04820 [Candidatus Daviesbacteria bacterium]|nr:hypothetical protein [Candidatus Daviesbacteria bacterium]
MSELESKQPAHRVVFDTYIKIMDDQFISTSVFGTADTVKLDLCEEILKKSQIPAEEIPSMIEALATRKVDLDPRSRSVWEGVLLRSLDRLTDFLAPPDQAPKS